MKTHSIANGAAGEEAALWAAKLDGSSLSATERAALETWLDAAPHHRDLLADYCQLSADLEQQLPLLEGIRDQVAEISAAPAPALSHPWLRWPLWAGVTLAAAAAVAFLLLRPSDNQFGNFVTPVAQRQALTLADGTKVELNAHTNLQVAFDSTSRHVRLASGQAFFAVTRDSNRPFIVETPAGAVRVTGTAFDVRADPAVFEVTVQEGSVQVSPAHAAAASLKAGQQLTVRNSSAATRALSPVQLNNTLAWRDGFIVFEGATLDEVLARFSRYHGRSLTAAPGAAEKTIGGRFSLDDLEGFFTELETDLYPELRVSRDRNGAVRVDLRAPQP